MAEETIALTQLLARVENKNSQEHRKTREMIADSQEIISRLEIVEVPYEKENEIRRTISNGILEELNFETRTHRFEELNEAYQKTFEWVFDEKRESALVQLFGEAEARRRGILGSRQGRSRKVHPYGIHF